MRLKTISNKPDLKLVIISENQSSFFSSGHTREHRMVAFVRPFTHDRGEINSPPRHQEPNSRPRCYFACVCALPLAFVAIGAILVGSGIGKTPPAIARNILTTVGMAVYIIGVLYFVIINLADQSCTEEEKYDCESPND